MYVNCTSSLGIPGFFAHRGSVLNSQMIRTGRWKISRLEGVDMSLYIFDKDGTLLRKIRSRFVFRRSALKPEEP